MVNFKKLKEIKGDASFRKFYRDKNNYSIVVYAKKEKVKNLLIYDAINKILKKNKILAPKLLYQNYKIYNCDFFLKYCYGLSLNLHYSSQ